MTLATAEPENLDYCLIDMKHRFSGHIGTFVFHQLFRPGGREALRPIHSNSFDQLVFDSVRSVLKQLDHLIRPYRAYQ